MVEIKPYLQEIATLIKERGGFLDDRFYWDAQIALLREGLLENVRVARFPDGGRRQQAEITPLGERVALTIAPDARRLNLHSPPSN